MKKLLPLILTLFFINAQAGVLVLDMAPVSGSKKVYLISVSNGNFTLEDSSELSTGRQFFPDLAAGYYSLKVVYEGDATHLPTYLGDVAHWDDADSAYVGATMFDSTFKTITAIDLSPLSGTGTISGSITEGNLKISAFGDPINNVQVMLLDASNDAPLAYTFTDASGDYQFTNVPDGNYKIYGEVVNKPNDNPPTATISPSNQSETVDIWVNSNGVSEPSSTTGTSKGATVISNLYPNPVKDQLVIELKQSADRIEVLNTNGKVILSQNTGSSLERVDCSALTQGVYYLKIYSGEDVVTEKIVKE